MSSSFEASENVFLKMPHFFKPLQALNAVILAICVGSTASSDNGLLWFAILVSLLISAAATVIFATGFQDQLMDSLSNGAVSWNIVELIYSFVLSILSVICVWLSFSFANRSLYGTSAGYIASGLFFIVQTALYASPCVSIYRDVKNGNELPRQQVYVEPANPFRNAPYQDF
ncbi:unnamed protein product [Caenorhabditis auriculariae]|uniref:MARVEL domain-containing protein n=1 Tax=Caenorhabditis auriculariae TaxID=2777116 RepID=A0A8S1H6P4_9PELO|nr:unnamed protein product [Caenorhabditis auriculariae]